MKSTFIFYTAERNKKKKNYFGTQNKVFLKYLKDEKRKGHCKYGLDEGERKREGIKENYVQNRKPIKNRIESKKRRKKKRQKNIERNHNEIIE